MVKRWIVILLVIPLLASCALEKTRKLNLDYTRNHLFPIKSHDAVITVHPSSGLIVFDSKMVVDRKAFSDYPTGSFILNQDIHLNFAYVEGTNQIVKKLLTAGTDYFGHTLTKEQWEKLSRFGNIYELDFLQYAEGQDEVTVTLKYSLKATDQTPMAQTGNDGFSLYSDYFLLPSNFSTNIPSRIEIRTPKRFNITISGQQPAETSLVNERFKSTVFQLDSLSPAFVIRGE